ncbi:hypothetical protein HYE67_005037 [Fusarium culmorum]|uniref:F-box domain-containing protein n=2 Tax=Fusarium culmorum TaxID=5516 RepID=A0A7S8D6D5_FUSCU|nr:hypothetical protein HYE67_005037 [Fusarium culmorum]
MHDMQEPAAGLSCGFAAPSLPLRERRKSYLPGEQQPWALIAKSTPVAPPQPISVCYPCPIEMPLKSMELLHYFHKAGGNDELALRCKRQNLLASSMHHPDALRNTLLIAGFHYIVNAGRSSDFKPTLLLHKIETIRSVNKWLQLSDSKAYAIRVRFELVDVGEEAPPEVMAAMHDRYKVEAGGMDLKLRSMEMIPYFFAPLSSMRGFCDIDASPMIKCLLSMTEICQLRAPATDEKPVQQIVWLEGAAVKWILAAIETHVESMPWQDDRTRKETSPGGMKSSWSGLFIATQLYVHQVLGLWILDAPLEVKFHSHILAYLSWDLARGESCLEAGSTVASNFWFWKAFVGAFSLARHIETDHAVALYPLRRQFVRLLYKWSEATGIKTWKEAREILIGIVWPKSAFTHAHTTWLHCLSPNKVHLKGAIVKSILYRVTDMVAIHPVHQPGAPIDLLARCPDLLIVSILETLPKHDLCSVSRLNKRYHALADAVLYNTVQWLKPELHLIFSQSLSRRPRRGSAIEEVKLAYPASEITRLISDTLEPMSSVSQTISTMSNLKTLDIAVPVGLLHSIGNLFNGPFDLACLQSCTLFYQDEDDQYWDLQENIHIFTHPTLETLVIKRAKLDDRGFEPIERPHNTALKTLHLIECDINDDTLSDVLMFPEALKEFVLTQREEPEPELEESSSSIRDYMMALKEQCHSLETITIDFPMLASGRALALREFVKLKTLRLNWDYQLFGKSTKKPRLHSVGLPPELETLEFFNPLGTDEEVTDLLANAIQSLHITCRKMKELIVLVEEAEIPKEVLEAIKSQSQLHLSVIGGEEDRDDPE